MPMNEITQPLLIRPIIWCDESVSGFLHRIANMNRYRFSYLRQALFLSVYEAQNNEMNQDTLQKLEIMVNINSLSEQNGYNLKSFFGSDLYSKILMKNKVKYCPLCIRQIYYHRTVWSFSPFYLCNEHNVRLIDECPQCGHLISIAAFSNQRCESCSFYYVNARCETNENEFLMVSQQQLINSVWEKEKHVLLYYNFVQYLQLAFHSFHLIVGGTDYTGMTVEPLDPFHNHAIGEKGRLKLAVALANVYWMYLDFPKNFNIVMSDFLIRNKHQKRYGRLKGFEKIFDSQVFKLVHKAYNAFFIAQIDEGNVRKDFSVFKRDPIILESRRMVRREEVRQATGIAYERLHELNDFKELQIETKFSNGKQRYLVERASLATYLSNRQNLITKKEVGLLIGVVPASIVKIIDSGYLTPIRVANSQKIVFSVEEVNKLVDDCLGEIIEEFNSSMIKFHNVLSKYAKYAFTILEIISFTYSGHLKPFRISKNRSLADNYYDEGELEVCMDFLNRRRQEEKGYYFNDVMKMLKIGEKRLWRILNEQGIDADFTLVMKDGRKRYFFKEETISKIRWCINPIEGLS